MPSNTYIILAISIGIKQADEEWRSNLKVSREALGLEIFKDDNVYSCKRKLGFRAKNPSGEQVFQIMELAERLAMGKITCKTSVKLSKDGFARYIFNSESCKAVIDETEYE